MSKINIETIKNEYALEMGEASWYEMVAECDPQMMDRHIDRIAERYAASVADKRHFYDIAAQAIITAMYSNTAQTQATAQAWTKKYDNPFAYQESAAEDALAWAITLSNTFNKEAIC